VESLQKEAKVKEQILIFILENNHNTILKIKNRV
jgi:hypothetical protein